MCGQSFIHPKNHKFQNREIIYENLENYSNQKIDKEEDDFVIIFILVLSLSNLCFFLTYKLKNVFKTQRQTSYQIMRLSQFQLLQPGSCL